MRVFLKSESEIENIIKDNEQEKKDLIRVSANMDRPLGYFDPPNKNEYEETIDYFKAKIKYIRSHYYGKGYYFGTKEYKNEIVDNYSQLSYKNSQKQGVIVEKKLTQKRHLKIQDAIKSKILGKVFHNTPPSFIKYMLINFLAKKYELDSYEVGGLRKLEIAIWKRIHNIVAKEDGNYIIIRNKDVLEDL